MGIDRVDTINICPEAVEASKVDQDGDFTIGSLKAISYGGGGGTESATATYGSIATGTIFKYGGGTAYITAYASGSFAGGRVYNNSDTPGYHFGVVAGGHGSFAHGYTIDSGTIKASAPGSFAQGAVNGASGSSLITATSTGAHASGSAESYYEVSASGEGSFAHGFAEYSDVSTNADNAFQFGPGDNQTTESIQVGDVYGNLYTSTGGGLISSAGTVTASYRTGSGDYKGVSGYRGTLAVGTVYSYDTYYAYIAATGSGSWAGGVAHAYGGNAQIQATTSGALAFGYAKEYSILASGNGSVALGYATGDITAYASNSMQFGPGYNNNADSLQVGANASLRASGALHLAERPAADSYTGGWSQLWVKNVGAGELWFTDDSGNDTKIV